MYKLSSFWCYSELIPTDKHEQDPAFLSEAKASVNQHAGVAGDSSQPLKKEDQVGQGNCGNGGGGCVVEVEAALAVLHHFLFALFT
ncbi:hypothetical protein SADUNF_Sadunf03G0048500 [Salix dunnii]|uniref:Uncharacterized protein n=1 Tax=Salix dunnii TaxID=1413687 RepID=A0A835K922_9ROSI|nr:hypothetical protein SADUNF_Sadunf03G0048500 [Salix dunnii]